MPEFLSDDLEALRLHLTMKCRNGLSRDQVNILVAILKNHKESALSQENETSKLTWNLNVKIDELNTASANLERAEELLLAKDPMFQVSNHVLDEIEREGSNVCLMKRLSNTEGAA